MNGIFQRPKLSFLTLIYALFIVLFGIFARDFLNFLLKISSKDLVKVLVWGLFLGCALWIGAYARRLPLRNICWMAVIFSIAVLYALTFDLFEERVHLVKYGVLAWLTCSDQNQKSSGYSFLVTIVFGAMVAMLDETVQYFTPGRVGDVRDVVFDIVGSVFGALLWMASRK